MPGVLTLTTDFGTDDHFVGVMKGVILKIAPSAKLIDITHSVTPFSVTEGAFEIGEAYRWFPKKTVHLVVVDPGVGSARRPIVVEAGGQYFVGPDNGVFSMIYSRNLHSVRHISNKKYFLRNVSQTFHGRDIFAPVAAHLARGVKPSLVGKRVDNYVRGDSGKPVRTGTRCWAGMILKVDRFGNMITNFHVEEFPDVLNRPFVLLAGIRTTDKLIHNFTEASPTEPAVVVGSSGFLEVVVNQGSAAKLLGCANGSPAELSIY